jgi:hypothetical protein
MNNSPMTPFGDRKAPKAATKLMEDTPNLTDPEDVEVPSWNVAELTEADTDESMTDTENPADSDEASVDNLTEDLPELPTPEEAELGELSQYPEGDLTAEPPTYDELFGDEQ